MSETTGTADAATLTSHSFNEVSNRNLLVLLQQSHLAGGDSITDLRLEFKALDLQLLDRLSDCIRQTTAASKDTAIVRSIVQNILTKRSQVEVSGIEQRLKFLKRHHAINVRTDLLSLELHLLCRARTNEHHLCSRIV